MGSTNLPESIVSKYGRDVRKLAEHPVHVEVEARLHLLERVALRLGRHVGVDVERNASANGSNQILIYPGSVSIGGAMQYKLGNENEPGGGDWIPAYGYMRAKGPGTYYVWWRTHNRDYYSAKYIGQGRSEITSQQPIVVTIEKGNINPTVSIVGWTYGESPKTPTVTGNTGNGDVTYEYKAKDADDSAYSEDVPFNAGSYTVRATVLESTHYKSGTSTADFTIAKIPVNATVAAKDKTYDGTTDANVSATVDTGVLEGDVVTITGLKGTFADANAGEGKAVAIDTTGVTFDGEGAANYEVAIPTATTATIEKRSVSVKADDKSSIYGEAIAELTYSLDGSTTLAEGDTLESLGITASTTASSSDSSIPKTGDVLPASVPVAALAIAAIAAILALYARRRVR